MNRCWSCQRKFGYWEVWRVFWTVGRRRIICPSCAERNIIRNGPEILAGLVWFVILTLLPYLIVESIPRSGPLFNRIVMWFFLFTFFGLVGSLLVPALLSLKHKVAVIDSLIYNQVSLLSCCINENFEFVKGDIRDRRVLVDSLKGVDCIIHLAAIVGTPACLKNKHLAREVNYEATVNLNKCRDRSQGIVFASTGSNYGSLESICTEETPLNPSTIYGITKTKAEEYLLDSSNVIIYRFATGFGVSPRMKIDLFINDMIFQAGDARHRNGRLDPLVQSGDPPAVGATAGTARYADSAGIDFGPRLQIV